MLLKNNTGETSKIGLTAVQDPKDPTAFIYSSAGDNNILGIITAAVPRNGKCEIATVGTVKVFCYERVVQGALIRAQKVGDNISRGTCKAAKPADAPYFLIGTALKSGKGLVDTLLNLSSGESASNYVPYTGATRDVDLGSNGLTATDLSIGGPVNKVTISSSGDILLGGDATVWDDLRILYGVVDVPGGTDPDVISWQSGGSGATFKVYAFAKGDEFFFTQQLPHDYKEGSDLYPHVHWTPGPRGNEENGNTVQWRLDYTIADHDTAFGASQTVALPDVCMGTDHVHHKSNAGTISGAGLHISSQLQGRFYRWNDASDTWAGTGNDLPIFLELDFHYTRDSMGSRTITAK